MILKFCGFKSEEDIQKVKNLNVDAVGFIHFPESKRHISINQLKFLSKLVPDYINRVVVLVNPTLELVKQILNLGQCGYDIASGIETNGVKDLEKMTKMIEIIKGDERDEHTNRS